MSDTTYVDYSPPLVNAAWLNDVNNVNYRVLGSAGVVPNTVAQLLSNIGVYSKTDSDASATAIATSVAASTTQSGSVSYAIDTGTANAYAITLSPAPQALTAGMQVTVQSIVATNTGPSTLNVNGLGAIPITDVAGNAIPAGVMLSGSSSVLVLNANKTAWLLLPFLQPSIPPIIDLTNVSSDTSLLVNQVGKIICSGQTSVPLHVATGDGQTYKIILSLSGNTGSTGGVFLAPNNTSYTNHFYALYSGVNSSSGATYTSGGTWGNSIQLGYNDTTARECLISTATTSKYCISNGIDSLTTGIIYTLRGSVIWSKVASSYAQPGANDTSTPWTSLGTVTSGAVMNGTIYVRRLS